MIPSRKWLLISVIAVIMASLIPLTVASNSLVEESSVAKNRTRRGAVFPYNAAMGLIVAIAVPLGIPGRNIFVSYNFEGNYNSPAQSNVWTEGLWNFIRGIAPPLNSQVVQLHRALDGDADVVDTPVTEAPLEDESTTTMDPSVVEQDDVQQDIVVKRSPTFTRKKIYRSIERHLEKQGYDGKKCLLRAICESNENPLHEHNGVLGDLVHIVFSPSASKDEHLPSEFYKAELQGHKQNCRKYHKYCDKSPLDLISYVM